MNTFWAFPETIVIKILKFWVHFVANIGKMVIENIRRNVTSYLCECLVLPGTSRFISDHIFWVIYAECMNIIEIDFLSLLDNTRYFIPKITVILP